MTARLPRLALVCALVTTLQGCVFIIVHGVRHAYATYTQQERDVSSALARYQTLRLGTEFEQVAEMFDLNGEMSRDDERPVIGPVAILTALKSPGSRMLAYELTAKSTSIEGKTATQNGTYRESRSSSSGDSVTTEGTFDARWIRQSEGNWLISRIHTAPSSSR